MPGIVCETRMPFFPCKPVLASIATGLLLAAAACAGHSQAHGAFVMAVDSGSRYSFRYVRHVESKKWVHLHCELRVASARALPEPTALPDVGELVHFTRFMPGAMATAGISTTDFQTRDAYRVWLYRGVADEADLGGNSSIGVQIAWPTTSPGQVRRESMEVIKIPALSVMTPYVWSSWQAAQEFRPGEFADWEKTSQRASADADVTENPFEMRCRPVLTDAIFVPAREQDSNILMADPSAAR
jgi:hypothetical protein